jgi:hypothetical protein
MGLGHRSGGRAAGQRDKIVIKPVPLSVGVRKSQEKVTKKEQNWRWRLNNPGYHKAYYLNPINAARRDKYRKEYYKRTGK